MCRNGDLSREKRGALRQKEKEKEKEKKKDYFVLERHEKCKIIYNVNY